MADIIKMPARPPAVILNEDGEETIGSLLARKRFLEGPRLAGKRRLGAVAMRKSRDAIQRDSDTIETCLRWLFQIATRDHDPRALAAMIEHWEHCPEFNPLGSYGDCVQTMAMIEQVMIEYRKRFPLPKPKLVMTPAKERNK